MILQTRCQTLHSPVLPDHRFAAGSPVGGVDEGNGALYRCIIVGRVHGVCTAIYKNLGHAEEELGKLWVEVSMLKYMAQSIGWC